MTVYDAQRHYCRCQTRLVALPFTTYRVCAVLLHKKAIYTPPISPTSYLSQKGYVTISPLYQSKRSNTVHFTNKALIYLFINKGETAQYCLPLPLIRFHPHGSTYG